MAMDPEFSHAPSCADDHDPDSLTPDEALARILAGVPVLEDSERVALRQALGRVLAEDVMAPFDVPGHANSAMDGFAMRGADLPETGIRELRELGAALAGRPFRGRVGPGECVRITTGGVIPEGADTVVMQEHAERGDGAVRIGPGHRAGQNVRTAGEDIARGSTVLRSGRRLVPGDLGLLASLGIGEVSVRRRLRVAFFSTGDELRSLGEPLAEGAVYDSNRYTLYGMLARLPGEAVLMDLGVVRDDPEDLRRAFTAGGAAADVLITSGGASVGEADFVAETLRAVGETGFWKIAMKPGRPFAFGRVGNAAYFGLPGNPVAVMVGFYQLIQPALRRMMGETDWAPFTLTARCVSRLKKKPGRVEYQRGILSRDGNGEWLVRDTGSQGSGILTSMSEANCFIILPIESGRVEAGSPVEVQPFRGLI